MSTTIITSAADLLAAYARDERDFSHRVRLPYGSDLSGANLSGAHLTGAHLGCADLGCADLGGADLEGANLHEADLSGAHLGGAHLGGAYLSGADLSDANLGGADLAGAYLFGARLSGANLRGADLEGANLRDADLAGAYLSGADLSGADLSGVRLSGANLRSVKNVPVGSHDLLAELLRQAAGVDVQRRAFAGLLLVSRDWCWQDYGRLREAGTWPAEIVAWVGETLGAHDSLAPFLRRYGWLPLPRPRASETSEAAATISPESEPS